MIRKFWRPEEAKSTVTVRSGRRQHIPAS